MLFTLVMTGLAVGDERPKADPPEGKNNPNRPRGIDQPARSLPGAVVSARPASDRSTKRPLGGAGGGVYNLGVFAFDVFTVIAHNHASTSNDNLFP